MLRLVALDGLRGIAAIAVVLFHVSGSYQQNFPFGMGYLAVDFFFLLSGFVIGHAYEPKLQSRRISLLGYARARVARLLPMILLGTVLSVAIFAEEISQLPVPGLVGVTMQALCIPILAFGIHLFPLNAVQWSLFYEVLANAFHALFLRRLSNGVLIAIMVLSFAALCVAAYFSKNALNGGFYLNNMWLGFARIGFSFFAGIALSRLHSASRLRMPAMPFWALAGALAGLLLLPNLDGPAWATLELAMVAIMFPAIVACGARTSARGVEAASARFLGSVSYPLYLIHTALLAIAWPYVTSLPPNMQGLGWALAITGIVLLAWVADLVFDQPAQRLLRGARPATTAAPVSPS